MKFRKRNADRFDDYKAIDAKFDSTGTCGHSIAKGDRIGYNSGNGTTSCKECWRKWSVENQEASDYENRF